jgi:hypothetical protein
MARMNSWPKNKITSSKHFCENAVLLIMRAHVSGYGHLPSQKLQTWQQKCWQ